MTRTFILTAPWLLILALTACADRDNETAPPPAADTVPAELPEPTGRSEPATEPPPAVAPEAAEGTDAQALLQSRADRQALRDRRQSDSGWWSDDALSERLGLDAEQRAALLQARETLLTARLEGRTRLQQQRSALRAAEQAQQAERLAELQADREDMLSGLEDAERLWQSTLRDILNTEQLQRLRAERPEALEPGRF